MNNKIAGINFKKECKGDLSYKALVRFLECDGIEVREFSAADIKMTHLLQSIGAQQELLTRTAFTYLGDGKHVVFVNAAATLEQKKDALLQEIGHYILRHGATDNIVGNTATENKAASDFAYYAKSTNGISIKKRFTALVCIALLAVGISIFLFAHCYNHGQTANNVSPSAVQANNSTDTLWKDDAPKQDAPESQTQTPAATPIIATPAPTGIKVYTTPSGDVYHLITCRYVVGKDNLAEWYIGGVPSKYRPCKVCYPPVNKAQIN